MTIIVAIKDVSGVYVGSDSIISSDDEIIEFGSKVVFAPNFAIAFSGSVKGGQLLFEHLSKCKKKINNVLDCMELARFIRKIYAKEGIQQSLSGVNFPEMDACLILCTVDSIYLILEDYSVLDVTKSGHTAQGAGGPYAAGALDGLRFSDLPPRAKLEIAIQSSIERHPNCGGNPHIYKVEYNERPKRNSTKKQKDNGETKPVKRSSNTKKS